MALSDPRKLSLSDPESTILDSYHAGVCSHALTYSPYPLSALLPDSALEGAETESGAVSKPQPKAWGT